MKRKTLYAIRGKRADDDCCHWYARWPPVPCNPSICPFKEKEGHCLLMDSPDTWPDAFFERIAAFSKQDQDFHGKRMAILLEHAGIHGDRIHMVLSSIGMFQGRA